MRTQISWMLSDHCTSECTYCPTRFRGGPIPRGILEYMDITGILINHYASFGRKIDWTFGGGEPLDMFDFPMMLKLCKDHDGTITLHTNGGKLWMDWWALEPRIDSLHLSYHYWQNPKLINFIIQTFQKTSKHINVIVPIRPTHFNDDLQRALDIESEFNIIVSKATLYNGADPIGGMFPYTEQQLRIMRGEDLVQVQKYFEQTTFQERHADTINNNPVYTGMLCNTGIEKLSISHDGWVAGSACNNRYLGNIWNGSLQLPTTPHRCGMLACIDSSDQQITKFTQ